MSFYCWIQPLTRPFASQPSRAFSALMTSGEPQARTYVLPDEQKTTDEPFAKLFPLSLS